MDTPEPSAGARRPAARATSLQARLLAATALLVAFALALAFAAFDRATERAVLEAERSHLAARAREARDATYRFQAERLLALRAWAEGEPLREALRRGEPAGAEEYLSRTIQAQDGQFSASALVDVHGAVVAAVRAAPFGLPRGETLTGARGRFLASEAALIAVGSGDVAVALGAPGPLDDQELAPQLLVAAPVRDGAGGAAGALVAVVPLGALTRLLADLDGGERRYLPVVRDGSGLAAVSYPDAPAAWRAVRPGPAGALEREALAGEPYLAFTSARGEDHPNWTAILLIPERAAFAPLRRARALLAGVSAAVLLLAAAASHFALRRAAQPLAELSASMRRVAAGDLTARAPSRYSGELGELAASFDVMVREVGRSREELRRTEALRRELQIARDIQRGLRPRPRDLAGLEIAARTRSAEEVGGDLYDVIARDDGLWILVGDVSGHGVEAGMVMMLAQAAAHAAIAEIPGCEPRAVIAAVNRVLHEHVRLRMERDDYLTLTVLRHEGGGRFRAAGAHQPIHVARASGGVDTYELAGPWLGVLPDVSAHVQELRFELAAGDLLGLTTDGIVEAADPRGLRYGEARLTELLRTFRNRGPGPALMAIFSDLEAFGAARDDDVTAVLVRRAEVADA